jgi:hypothetical protein
MTTTLHDFEGRPVVAARVAITRAGDGLSEALAVEPEDLPLGQRVLVLLECEVTKVRYEEVLDTGTLRRVHTLSAGTATMVDDGFAGDLLDQQRIKIEQAKGVHRLPVDSNGDGSE